jgi:hypothetical protein
VAVRGVVVTDLLIFLIVTCIAVFGVWKSCSLLFDPPALNSIPWALQLQISCMTDSDVASLLYCIGQESELAYKKMPILCALCGVPYPPALNLSENGSGNVPSNAANSTTTLKG